MLIWCTWQHDVTLCMQQQHQDSNHALPQQHHTTHAPNIAAAYGIVFYQSCAGGGGGGGSWANIVKKQAPPSESGVIGTNQTAGRFSSSTIGRHTLAVSSRTSSIKLHTWYRFSDHRTVNHSQQCSCVWVTAPPSRFFCLCLERCNLPESLSTSLLLPCYWCCVAPCDFLQVMVPAAAPQTPTTKQQTRPPASPHRSCSDLASSALALLEMNHQQER